MKILYISPQNTVGTLGLWQRIHQDRGHECRYVTYFPSPMGFPDDICLLTKKSKNCSKSFR